MTIFCLQFGKSGKGDVFAKFANKLEAEGIDGE